MALLLLLGTFNTVSQKSIFVLVPNDRDFYSKIPISQWMAVSLEEEAFSIFVCIVHTVSGVVAWHGVIIFLFVLV